MKPRLITNLIAVGLASFILYLAIAGIAPADDPPAPQVVTVETESTVQGKTAVQWHAVAAKYRRHALERWHPTVDYALHLASAVFGVSYWQMRAVSFCESRHYPYAVNGRYKGLFQLGWAPFGFSPFDPVANALSAAATVRHDGSWRQWECKP